MYAIRYHPDSWYVLFDPVCLTIFITVIGVNTLTGKCPQSLDSGTRGLKDKKRRFHKLRIVLTFVKVKFHAPFFEHRKPTGTIL